MKTNAKKHSKRRGNTTRTRGQQGHRPQPSHRPAIGLKGCLCLRSRSSTITMHLIPVPLLSLFLCLISGSIFVQLFVLSPALYKSQRQDDGASSLRVPHSSIKQTSKQSSSNTHILASQQLMERNDTGTSSCVLVMDDNHFLVEWLAYHYHVIKLRHLIVAVDPRSLTSPKRILERWKGLMDIVLWDDEDSYINHTKFYTTVKERLDGNHGKRESSILSMHRVRQLTFNMQCMMAHKRKDRGWTFITDIDEYTYVNPRLWKEDQKLYQPDFEALPSIREVNSVYKMLQSLRFLNPRTVHAAEQYPCIRIARRQFASIDDNAKGSSIKSALPVSMDKFQTQRWRKYEFIDDHHGSLAGKTIIDLAALSLEDLEAETKEGGGDPHFPLPNICAKGSIFLSERHAPLLANHYMGTREQWNFRSNDSRGAECLRDLFDHQNNIVGKYHSDEVVPWLEGFVNSTGLEEASRLLEGVGELESVAEDDEKRNFALALPKEKEIIRVGDRAKYNHRGDWYHCTVMASNCRGGYDVKCDENDFWEYALRSDDLFLILAT